MSKKPFTFKQFVVNQHKTAMKIGTDAVLLGAWCSLSNLPHTILDIGSGTGVISLMLAQRSTAFTIDAVEVDANAYEQSVENFEQSDWSDRLYAYHCSFQDFADEIAEEQEAYDLIVSNPPFYTDTFETDDASRNKARFSTSLTFFDLIQNVAKILAKNGTFSVIIPSKETLTFIKIADTKKLYLNRMCQVQGNPQSEIKRSLLSFSFHKSDVENSHLIIENKRHQYTADYINLTKDFYLKM